MSRFRVLTLGFTFAALLATGTLAAADPILISSGFLRVSGAQDMSRGFLRSISYDLFTEAFRLQWNEGDGVPQNVFAPRLVTPSFWITGGADDLVAVASDLSVSTTPAASPTRFQLDGTLTLFDRPSGAVLFNDQVFGTGTATWQFILSDTGNAIVSGVTYEFESAAVPEPAILLLLGVGLSGLAARRKLASSRR